MARSTVSFAARNQRPRMLVQRDQYLALPRQRSGIANLWQMPVLLVSLGLFTLSAYLFVDPQPAAAFQTQTALAASDLAGERFDAAIGRLNDLLATRPEPAEEAEARLLLAEALDLQLRRNRRLDTPAAHRRIIEEIELAYKLGQVPTVQTSDRLARSYEALGNVEESAANYQRAVEMHEQAGRPHRALPMRRSAIDMLIAFDRQVSAIEAIDRFLAVAGLADDERAWALTELARLHIDAGQHSEARNVLSAAAALTPDLVIQGRVNFCLGYAAWKLGRLAEAREQLLTARQQLGEDHPQEAEACFLLGRIAQDEQNFPEAIAWLDLSCQAKPEGRIGARAAVARAVVLALVGDDAASATELARIAGRIGESPALAPVQGELLEAVQRTGRILAARESYELALELLILEQELDPEGAPEALARRSRYLDGLIEQAEADLEAADAMSAAAKGLRLRELRSTGAQAHLDYALSLAAAGDPGYAGLLWKAVDEFERAGASAAAAGALKRFIDEQPNDEILAQAMLRLARLQLAEGEESAARATIARLRADHSLSQAALEAGILLAELLARGGEYEPALSLLNEMAGAEMLPALPRGLTAQLAFLRAQCHRELALAVLAADSDHYDTPAGSEPQLASAVTDERARRHLEQAENLFAEALDLAETSEQPVPADQNWQRLAAFGRAHCVFDLGRHEEAIALYRQAASRHPDDISTLTAQVQIASANAALGRADQSRQAAQEIRRLLEQIPAADFARDASILPRRYWQRWLRGMEAGGLW